MEDQNKWAFNDMKRNTIEDVIDADEHILYRSQPKRSAYILSHIIHMLPIALIWILFDGGFIATMIISGTFSDPNMPIFVPIFLVVFFAFHLTPVWIWLGGIIKSMLEYKNVDYAFTDKKIIIRNGIIGIDFKFINYNEIESINLKVGIIDKMLKVGDIYVTHGFGTAVIYDIDHPYEILSKLQKITLDIKSDIQYPNNLRPEYNDGYNTKYNG